MDHTNAVIQTEGSPDNLLTNFESRSTTKDQNAYQDSAGSQATGGSCYYAKCDGIGTPCGGADTTFGLNIIFSEVVYLHALLVVFDTIGTNFTPGYEDWEIIGYAADGTANYGGPGNGDSGKVFWYNKEIKSFKLKGNNFSDPAASWTVSICALGPMGTIYERAMVIPPQLNYKVGETIPPLVIPHIAPRAGLEVTNVLDIEMGFEYGSPPPGDFSISNDSTAATINIATQSMFT